MSPQDRNPLVRLLRASYALGWLITGLHLLQNTLTRAWNTSLFSQRLLSAVGHTPTDSQALRWWSGWLPGVVGWLGIMLLCAMAGTGAIGAATWALFGALVVVAIVFRQSLWLSRLNALDVLILLWFATYAVATAFASFQHEALAGLFKMATYLAAWLGLRMMLSAQPRLWPIWMAALVGLGALEAVIGMVQHQAHVDPLATWSDPRISPDQQLTRVFGTLKPANPNLLAGYLVPAWGAGLWWLGQLVATPAMRRRWPWIVIVGIALALITVGIVLTGSRGGYLGLLGMLVTTFLLIVPLTHLDPWLERRASLIRVAWWGLLALMGLGAGLLIWKTPSIATRLMSITKFYEDSSIAYRLHVYDSSWRMFLDNWLTGIGPGNGVFKQVYGIYMTPGFNALGTYSVPLAILVEQGIVGGLVALLVFGTVVVDRLLWWADERLSLSQRLSILAGLVALVGIACHGLFDTVLYRPAIQTTFWLWMAGFVSQLPPFFVGPSTTAPVSEEAAS